MTESNLTSQFKELEGINIGDNRVYVDADGVEYISVTTAIKLCSGGEKTESLMYWASQNSNYKQLQEDARNFGTIMHALTDVILESKKSGSNFVISETEISDIIWNAGIINIPYEPAWAFRVINNWIDQNVTEVILSEATIHSDSLGLAGRLDCLVHTKTWGVALIDFKFSKNPKQSHDYALQLATYKYMLNEQGFEIDNAFNLFPNIKNKKQPYTISGGQNKIDPKEVELVAQLARIRHARK